MEFQLKEGWFDYLISGFLFGTFIMLVVMIYSFGSTSGFPYDTYLLVLFVDFVCFIVTFVLGSHKLSSPNGKGSYGVLQNFFSYVLWLALSKCVLVFFRYSMHYNLGIQFCDDRSRFLLLLSNHEKVSCSIV